MSSQHFPKAQSGFSLVTPFIYDHRKLNEPENMQMKNYHQKKDYSIILVAGN